MPFQIQLKPSEKSETSDTVPKDKNIRQKKKVPYLNAFVRKSQRLHHDLNMFETTAGQIASSCIEFTRRLKGLLNGLEGYVFK